MNLVFIGTARFGIPALEKLASSAHRVLAVVTQPDRPRGRGLEVRPSPIKEKSTELGLHLYRPESVNEYEFLREIRALSPDAIVVVAYGQKLGEELLQLCRFCALNIHPSLLPRYRGPAPVARAILNGERETGVSVIKLVSRMDAGPVFGAVRVPIPPEATTPELEDELSRRGAQLLLEVLDKMEKGQAVETPQNEREATYARKFERREGRVDWRKPARRIVDSVRALQPFPGAFTFHNRRRIILYKVRAERSPARPSERPGTIVALQPNAFRVSCSDGFVDVLEVQPESRRRMPAEEFLRAAPLRPGDRLA